MKFFFRRMRQGKRHNRLNLVAIDIMIQIQEFLKAFFTYYSYSYRHYTAKNKTNMKILGRTLQSLSVSASISVISSTTFDSIVKTSKRRSNLYTAFCKIDQLEWASAGYWRSSTNIDLNATSTASVTLKVLTVYPRSFIENRATKACIAHAMEPFSSLHYQLGCPIEVLCLAERKQDREMYTT